MAYFYATIGIVALGMTISSLNRHIRANGIDATFLYFVALTVLPSLTGVVAQLTGGRQVTVGFGGESSVSMSGAAVTAASITPILIVASALTYTAVRLLHGANINTTAAWLLVVLVCGIFGNYQATQALPGGLSFLTYAAAAPLILAPRNRSGLSGSAHALGILIGLSGIVAVFAPELVMVECDARKCGPLGHLFSGISLNYNSLGMLLALAVPVVYLGLSKFALPVALIAAMFGLSSGSRTSQLAIIVTLALMLLHAYKSRSHNRLPVPIFVIGVAVPAALAVILPFSGLDPVTFTGRSGLWELALTRIAEYPFVGLGPDSWLALGATGDISRASAYSPHNQTLEVLFVAGSVGLLAFAGFIAHVIHSNRGHLATILLLFAPMAVLSITERPWSVGRLDWVSWSLLLATTIWLHSSTRGFAKVPNALHYSAVRRAFHQEDTVRKNTCWKTDNDLSS